MFVGVDAAASAHICLPRAYMDGKRCSGFIDPCLVCRAGKLIRMVYLLSDDVNGTKKWKWSPTGATFWKYRPNQSLLVPIRLGGPLLAAIDKHRKSFSTSDPRDTGWTNPAAVAVSQYS